MDMTERAADAITECIALRAENERLRAALEMIVLDGEVTPATMKDARAALAKAAQP